jgi:hypothetical protein
VNLHLALANRRRLALDGQQNALLLGRAHHGHAPLGNAGKRVVVEADGNGNALAVVED